MDCSYCELSDDQAALCSWCGRSSGAADLVWPPDSRQAIDIFIEAVQRSGRPEDCKEHRWVLEILVRRLRERRPETPTEEVPELEEFAMRVQGTRSEVEEEVDPYVGYCEFCDEANRGEDCHGLCGGSPARSDDGRRLDVERTQGVQDADIMDDRSAAGRGGLGEDQVEVSAPRPVGGSQEERSQSIEAREEEREEGEGGSVKEVAVSTLVLDEGGARCEVCGQAGHRWEECPQTLRPIDCTLYCLLCECAGHTTYSCRTKKGKAVS